ncbi:protein ELC-like [Sesamum indicum]|uniref:Protein ELC-like n=1 Tax=Sesamum indicum TaxID=4182 RepID=A0A6I9T993_SESIN|nr:protein ELC-like [Sesamum indicum]
MSSPNPIHFVEDALFCAGPLALSYSDPDQKWVIREHLISLFQDFPSLRPSTGFFTHNDGTEVKLLYATGDLPVSRPSPPVPVTIWVPELYPQAPPFVYVNVECVMHPIYDHHPFVDSSGATVSSYLLNWQFSKCNLSDLVRSLIKLFSHNHPFHYSGPPSSTHPSMVTKMEAVDRVACMIHYDMAAIRAKNGEEIERFSALQSELKKRAEIVEYMMLELQEEKKELKGRTRELYDESDRLVNWLKVHSAGFPIDDAFGAGNRKSEMIRECLAGDLAVEDLMYALEKGIEEGVVSFEAYMKQVRVCAREQFLHRAKLVKIGRGPMF